MSAGFIKCNLKCHPQPIHSNYKSLSLRADNVYIPAVVNVRGRVLV